MGFTLSQNIYLWAAILMILFAFMPTTYTFTFVFLILSFSFFMMLISGKLKRFDVFERKRFCF